jgi:uncharacterized protein (TIGR02266 family)
MRQAVMRKKVDQRGRALAQFRQFMSLERRRSAGLSVSEFATWLELKGKLERAFGTGAAPPGANQRTTPRIPVTVRVSFDAIGHVRSSLMTNLSRGGMFVPIEHPPEIGTELELRIDVARPRTEIRVAGVVVSRNVGPGFRSEQKGMGIHFTKLSDEARKLIDDLYESEAERRLESESD